MEEVYVVIYEDGSWGNHGRYILAVYDNEKQAQELVERVRVLKHDFEGMSGSGCDFEIWPLNQDFDLANIDYYH